MLRTGLLIILLALTFAPAANADYAVNVTVQGGGTVAATDPAEPTACTSSGPCTITTTGNETVHCSKVEEICVHTFWVELTATPASGWAFDHFTPASACAAGRPMCTRLVLDVCTDDGCRAAPMSVTAVFLDTTPPSVALSAPAAGLVRQTIALSATATDNAGLAKVDFSVNGQVRKTVGAAPFATTLDTTSLSDGRASIQAIATDAAGNTASSRPVEVVIDNTGPTIAVSGPDQQTFALGSTQTWKLSAADATSSVASLSCSVVPRDSAPVYHECSGEHSVSGEPGGAYTFSALAVDAAGNATAVTRAFTIDGTPPETTIVSGPADGASTTDTTLTWGIASSEAGSTFGCRVYPSALTPGSFATCAASHTAVAFTPGTYIFEVRAIDAFGNVDPTPARRTFTVIGVAAAPGSGEPDDRPVAGSGSAPDIAVPPALVSASLSFFFTATAKATRFSAFAVSNAPAGATVTVTCTGGCPLRRLIVRNVGGRVTLTRLLKRPFRPGAVITVTIAKPGATATVKILKIRKRKRPALVALCKPPAARAPQPC